MARVFLSYRRADGPYAVGWIAERLANTDGVTDVRTAFSDSEIRCGDEFPRTLTEAVEACDVFVAVIGEHWCGKHADGTSRIKDPGDWVARELTGALDAGKLIMPVLVGDTEPLTAADLAPEHAVLADLHAVRFSDPSDLDDLVSHLRSHLDEMDRERAKIAGLSEPLRLGRLVPSWVAIGLAALVAPLGALAGWLITDRFYGGGEPPGERALWVTASTIGLALGAALGVVGWDLWRRFRALVSIRWRPVLITVAFALLLFTWTGVDIGAASVVEAELGVRLWLLASVNLALLAPWLLMLAATGWTASRLGRHELGARARLIGELERVSSVAAIVLAIAAIPPVLGAAGVRRIAGGLGESYTIGELITYGLVLSLALTAALTWNRTRLERESVAVAADLAALAPVHRANAEAVLVQETFDTRARWILVVLVLPVVTTLVIWGRGG